MTRLTFEEKLDITRKNIEERVSRAGGVPERLYEDIVSFFTTCETDPKERECIEGRFRKADLKEGICFSIDKVLGRQISASPEAITEPLEQAYLLAFFLENLPMLEYDLEYDRGGRDFLLAQLILPIKFVDGEEAKKRLKDYLPVNTDEAVMEFHRLLLLSFVEMVEAHIPSIRNCHSHNYLGHIDWEAFKATCRAVRPDGDSACVESVITIDFMSLYE